MNMDIERLKVDESLWPDESVGCWVVTDDSGNFVKHLFVHDPRHTTAMDENQRAKYIPRPEPATEWDGDDRPLASCRCEILGTPGGSWSIGVIDYIDERHCIWHWEGRPDSTMYNRITEMEFRPIRTKAERDREELISIITRSDDMAYSFRPDDIADAILAAGWKKPD